MSNDCTYGLQAYGALKEKYGLRYHWCFVAFGDVYHGMSRAQVEEAFRTADIYLDMGAYGNWATESAVVPMRLLLEVE